MNDEKISHEYPTEVRIKGLEALVSLLLSSLPIEQRTKLSVNALELIKIIKSQPMEHQTQYPGLEDYLALILDAALDLEK